MDPLIHLTLIWISVYLSVLAAAATRMTPVLYFLCFGSLMVNFGLLPVESHPFIRGFAEIGLILIMLALGFEESPVRFVKTIKRSWGIALFGAIAPFCTAFTIAEYLWGDRSISMMCGLTMTATAVSLTMVSLRHVGLHKSAAARGVMTSAVLDDVGSLALVAILVPFATGQAVASVYGVSLILLKAILFFIIVILLGACIFPHDRKGLFSWLPMFGARGIKTILSFDKGKHVTLTVLLLGLLIGILGHFLGFHPAVGAYMAGLILREEFFLFHRYPEINYYEKTRNVLNSGAFSWIGPVFFVELGTKLIFEWDLFLIVIPYTLLLTISLMIAQISSASLAARFIGKFRWDQSLMIGFGMLGRAELAFVVMNIAYVEYPILSTEAFYTLMFTAFWLNISVPITISLWKPHCKSS